MQAIKDEVAAADGNNVEAMFKPSLSDASTDATFGPEPLRELLAPQWNTLREDIWAGGGDLDNFQPGLGHLYRLAVVRYPEAGARAHLDYLVEVTTRTRRRPRARSSNTCVRT